MREITDPALLAQLEAPDSGAAQGLSEVTDPAITLNLDHGFDAKSFGMDYRAARTAIDALPENVRQQAIDAYAREYVTNERKDGGIGQTITDHVRMGSRNVPYVGEFLDEANAGTAALLGGDYGLAHAAEQERRRQIDATDRAGIETGLGRVDTGDLAKTAGLVGGVMAAPWAKAVSGAGLLPAGVNAGINTGLIVGADKAGQTDGSVVDRVDAGVKAGVEALPIGFGAGVLGAKVLGAASKTKPVYGPSKTTQALKESAGKAYQVADDAGVIFHSKMTGRLHNDIVKEATAFGYHPGLQPKIGALVREAERLTENNVTMKGMDQFRKMAATVMRDGAPSERALAGKILDKIDDAIMSPQKGDVITGAADKASKALVEARGTWKTMLKSDAVDTAIKTAKDRAASTGSGGNIENATRQELRKLLTNKRTMRLFSAAEKADIQAVVAGTATQNILRRVGRLSPEGNGLMLMGHLGFGIATSGGFLAAPMAGFIAKRLADSGTRRGAEQILKSISGGGQIGTRLSAWQKVISGSATEATKRVATASLAKWLASTEGGDEDKIEQSLLEAMAEGVSQ